MFTCVESVTDNGYRYGGFPHGIHRLFPPPLRRSSMLTWPTRTTGVARTKWAASGGPTASGRSVAVRRGGRRTLSRSMGHPFRVPRLARHAAPLTVARRSALPLWWTRRRVPSGTTKRSVKWRRQRPALTSPRIRSTRTCRRRRARTK